MTSLVVAPDAVLIVSNTMFGAGASQLIVTGVRDDGTTVDLTHTDSGTTYQFEDPSFGGVTPDGRILATGGAGQSDLIVSNGTLQATIPVVFESFTPTTVGSISLDEPVGPISVEGNRGVIGLEDGLRCLDTSVPSLPRLAGTVELGAEPLDVRMNGTHVVAALGDAGVALVDVTEPDDPSVVSIVPLGVAARSAVIGANRAEVATDAGLYIVNVFEPGIGLVDIDQDGADDRIATKKLESTSFAWVDWVFGSGLLVNGNTVRTYTNGATPEQVFFSAGKPGPAVYQQALHLGGMMYGSHGQSVSQSSLTSDELTSLVTPPGSSFDPTGPIARYGDVLLIANKFNFNLVVFARAGAGQMDALGSLDFEAITPSQVADGVAVNGEYHYVTAGTQLLIGRHDRLQDPFGVPPAITLAEPTGDTVVEGTSMNFRVLATDDVGVSEVVLSVDGEVVANVNLPPYEVTIQLPDVSADTPMLLEATAVDTGGNTTVMPPRTVTIVPVVDLEPPQVAFVTPLDGGFTGGDILLPAQVNTIDDLGICSMPSGRDGRRL